jgi:hypothetical protein
MQTSMFSTVTHPTSNLYQFFFPSLQPLEVVKKIIASLDDRHSKTIYLPLYATLSPLSLLVPSFIRDLLQRVSVSDYSGSQAQFSDMVGLGKQIVGADYSMQEFKKDGGERVGEQGVVSEN